MELTNILIIASAAVVVLLFWIIVGVRHLKNMRVGVSESWEIVDERLRKRQNLIPNLIETVRVYDHGQETVFEGLINERMRAAKEYEPSALKIEYEHDLSQMINTVIALGKNIPGLGKDTNFLELKSDINEVEKKIEELSASYNEVVRRYNKSRKSIFLRPLAAVFGLKRANIFEVEI